MRFGLSAVLVAAALAGCDPGPELAAYNSWISVSETTHDFGVIPHGEVRRHRFWVENTSPQRVRLRGIRNQCSCAVVKERVLHDGVVVAGRPIHNPPKMDKGGYLMTWLEPGDRLEVTVEVDTRLRPPLDHEEPSLSELWFEPKEAGKVVFSYRFRIRARVRIWGDLASRISPVVDLGEFGKDQEVFGVLEIGPREGGRPFEVVGIDGPDDRLRLVPKKALHPGGHRWLVQLLPNGKPGPVERRLGIKTDLPGGYVLPVGISGVAVPNLQFMPYKGFNFGRFPFSKPKREFVTLIYHRPAVDPEFTVGQVEVKSGEADVSSYFEFGIDGGEARRWTLWVRYRGHLDAKRFAGWVQLESSDPDHRSTVVGFTGYNSEKR